MEPIISQREARNMLVRKATERNYSRGIQTVYFIDKTILKILMKSGCLDQDISPLLYT